MRIVKVAEEWRYNTNGGGPGETCTQIDGYLGQPHAIFQWQLAEYVQMQFCWKSVEWRARDCITWL